MQYSTLVAFEHDSVPVLGDGDANALSLDEADRLARIGETRPGFCERAFNSVRLQQYCGIVTTGSRVLEVLPKTFSVADREESRGLVLKLLRSCRSLPIARQLDTGQQLGSASLIDVFIGAFLDCVSAIARGGLLRSYREHDEDLALVRGKILLNRQLTALMDRQDVVACRYDDLTPNNGWNQLLKAALSEIRPDIRAPALQRRWIELFALFDEVQAPNLSTRSFNGLVFDRHATRYRTAIEWARWIIASLSPELAAGAAAAPGLLFDMNMLFQDYVAGRMLREIQRRPGWMLDVQDRTLSLAHLVATGATAFALQPDLVVSQQGRVVAIADTKWTRVARTKSGYIRPSESAMYQMLAYASRYGCDHLALIYPWHDGLSGSRETSFKFPPINGREPVVHIVCIELGRNSDHVRIGQRVPIVGDLLEDTHATLYAGAANDERKSPFKKAP